MMIRKAVESDINSVEEIYNKIHTSEEKGEITIGWKRGIYPVRNTAIAAFERGELYVMEDGDSVVGAGIINQTQVDTYAKGSWKYPAAPSEVMVLHTLVIDPEKKGNGFGKEFVKFYESFARQTGCKYLRIDTNEKNTSARKLYSFLGYEEIGCIPCVFNGLNGVNLILIEKAL